MPLIIGPYPLSQTKTIQWDGKDLLVKDHSLEEAIEVRFDPSEQVRLVQFLEDLAKTFME